MHSAYLVVYSLFRKKIKTTTEYIYQVLFVEGVNSDVTIKALDKEWKLHKLYLRQVTT